MSAHRAPERQPPLTTGATAAPGPMELVDTATDVIDAGPRPEPVLNAATLAGAISAAIISTGGLLKLITPWVPSGYDLQNLADEASNAVLAIGVVWATVGPWLTARLRARDKVTPLADPRTTSGRRLIPAPPSAS